MKAKTLFPEWLESRIHEAGITKAELAARIDRSPATVSRLVRGSLRPNASLRLSIATALGLSPSEIPDDINETKEPGSYRAVPLYTPAETPVPCVLNVIDQGIPDHTLINLANDLGLFRPFNITLAIANHKEQTYPRLQEQLFASSDYTSSQLSLVSCASKVISRIDNASATTMARVNSYSGYALVSRASDRITPPRQLSGEAQVRAFVELFDDILEQEAECNVNIVDEMGEQFYLLLLDLYKELTGFDIKTSYNNAPRENTASYKAYGLLESLDKIGKSHADFVIGHAYSIAVVMENSQHYALLLTADDVATIAQNARTLRRYRMRLESGSQCARESPDGAKTDDLKTWCDGQLAKLKLHNVWSLNIRFDEVKNSTEMKTLVCRIASVAYRLLNLLKDSRLRLDAMQRLRSYANNHPDDRTRFRAVSLETFEAAWKLAYTEVSFDANVAWIQSNNEDTLPPGMKEITNWLVDARNEYQNRQKLLDSFINEQDVPSPARENAVRAKQHFELFNFWDAHFFADKAVAAAEGRDKSDIVP